MKHDVDTVLLVCWTRRQHGGASGLGQNLAASAGYKQTGQQVVDAWMSEESDYNPSSPTYSHFTREYAEHRLVAYASSKHGADLSSYSPRSQRSFGNLLLLSDAIKLPAASSSTQMAPRLSPVSAQVTS